METTKEERQDMREAPSIEYVRFLTDDADLAEELLEALEGLQEEYNDRQGQFGGDYLWQKHEDEEAVNKARAAIAKARA